MTRPLSTWLPACVLVLALQSLSAQVTETPHTVAPGRVLLERAEQFEVLAQGRRGGGRDHGAHVGRDLHQAFGFEHPECIAQRCAGNTEQLAQARLGQPLSR